ncbi:MAG: PIN domain-containing protein [Gammaproteobacteria bacterium]
MRFTVVLDACVLYPATLRDFLLRLAQTGLFAARWTDRIHGEWIGALSKKRPELATKLARTRALMNQAIPDCLVTNYEQFIAGLTLPDANDRHVLAAALRCGAQIIVTTNTKHFPQGILDSYGVEAMHPDIFVEHQFGLSQALVVDAAKQHRAALRNPTMDRAQYLEALAAVGLVVTADKLREFVEFI